VLVAIPAVLTGALVIPLLAGERSGAPWRGWVKAAASTAFISTALAAGALDSPYGRWVLVALCLGWIGDVSLVSAARTWFLIGLIAFLLSHLAYVGAFAAAGMELWITAVALAALAVPAVLIGRWLWPHLPTEMQGPVAAYIVVISVMVAAAAGGVADAAPMVALPAALAFYLSDVSVARDRFVEPSFTNRLWGLPLYYAAQIMFALSVG
jgi:uncharacterized membrane protein YhhN